MDEKPERVFGSVLGLIVGCCNGGIIKTIGSAEREQARDSPRCHSQESPNSVIASN